MNIFSEKDCEKWVIRRTFFPVLTKVLLFEPQINSQQILSWNLADIGGKNFQHDIVRIKSDLNMILFKNFPQAKDILNNLNIFICPKPSADTANACAGKYGNNPYICYFGRSTQIPWCMTDYITAHELGHVIQQAFCSEFRNEEKMREYLTLRNAVMDDCEIYDDEKERNIIKTDFVFINGNGKQRQQHEGPWDLNPAEWFAEDFRFLFGIENGDKYWGLPIPKPNKKIRDFMMSLNRGEK